MILLTAYCSVNPDHFDRAIVACRKNKAAARTEAGCERFDFFQSVDEPNQLVFVEEWATRGDLEAHFAAPGFAEFFGVMTECMTGPPEIRIFEANLSEG